RGDVEARAAHVADDDGVRADHVAHVLRTQDAANRSGDHRLVEARVPDPGEPAVGEDRLDAVAEPVLLRGLLDADELLPAGGRGVRLDRGAVEARLLADDGTDGGGEVERDVELVL